MSFPLASCTLSEAGLALDPLERLFRLIDEHIAAGRYPGAQVAIARHGQLAVCRTFGHAVIAPSRTPAADETLWLDVVSNSVHSAINP